MRSYTAKTAQAIALGAALAGGFSPAYASNGTDKPAEGIETEVLSVGSIMPNARKLATRYMELGGVKRNIQNSGHKYMQLIIATCPESGYVGAIAFRTNSDYGAIGERIMTISVGKYRDGKDTLQITKVDSSTGRVLSVNPGEGVNENASLYFLNEVYDNLNRKVKSCVIQDKKYEELAKRTREEIDRDRIEWKAEIAERKRILEERKKSLLEELAIQN